MTILTMNDLSLAMSMLMQEKRAAQERMADLAAEETALREKIQTVMQEEGVKTFEGHGLQRVRSNRKSVNVTNEDELRSFIASTGRHDDYLKFDLVSAKKDAVKNGWPGVEEVVTDVLSVREGK